jgi:hypothetical protein
MVDSRESGQGNGREIQTQPASPKDLFLQAVLTTAAEHNLPFSDLLKTEGRAHPELMRLAPDSFGPYYGYFQFEGEPSTVVRASFPRVGIEVPKNANQVDLPFYAADMHFRQMEEVQVDLARVKRVVLGLDCIHPEHLPENFQTHFSNSQEMGQVVFGPPLQITQSLDYPSFVEEFQTAPGLITVINQSQQGEVIACILNVPTYFWPAFSSEKPNQDSQDLSRYRPTLEMVAELLTVYSLDSYQAIKKGNRIENLDFVYQNLGDIFEKALKKGIEKVFGTEIQPDQPWKKEFVSYLNQQGTLLGLLRNSPQIIPQLEAKAQV